LLRVGLKGKADKPLEIGNFTGTNPLSDTLLPYAGAGYK